jgi:hypothetical protein
MKRIAHSPSSSRPWGVIPLESDTGEINIPYLGNVRWFKTRRDAAAHGRAVFVAYAIAKRER